MTTRRFSGDALPIGLKQEGKYDGIYVTQSTEEKVGCLNQLATFKKNVIVIGKIVHQLDAKVGNAVNKGQSLVTKNKVRVT